MLFCFSFIWFVIYLVSGFCKILRICYLICCVYYFGFCCVNLRNKWYWDEYDYLFENLLYFIVGVRFLERLVVLNIIVFSLIEVWVMWCWVNFNKVEIDYYELFIDFELEYFGIDVMYVVKWFKLWFWYEIKLRVCGFSFSFCFLFLIFVLVKILRGSKCIFCLLY